MPIEYLSPTPVNAGKSYHYQKASSIDISDNAPLVYNTEVPRPGRTPSPTPSEYEALHAPEGFKRFADKKFMTSRKGIITVIVYLFFIAIIIVTSLFNDQIVAALNPAVTWLKAHSWGFIVPAAILFVLSFPPLFGQEIVEMLIGMTYGLWVGFAIVFVSTALGEIATFYVFKYGCGPRFEKMKKKSYDLASLSEIVQEGGFRILILFRYSAIPSHMVTALFATAGISFWSFLAALVLSAPTILVNVLLGVYYGMEGEDDINHITNDQTTKKYQIISWVVTGVTVAVTIFVMHWVRKLQRTAKERIIHERRKARQIDAQTSFYETPYDPAKGNLSTVSSRTMLDYPESVHVRDDSMTSETLMKPEASRSAVTLPVGAMPPQNVPGKPPHFVEPSGYDDEDSEEEDVARRMA